MNPLEELLVPGYAWSGDIAMYSEPDHSSGSNSVEVLGHGRLDDRAAMSRFVKIMVAMKAASSPYQVVVDLRCGEGELFETLYRNRRDISYVGIDSRMSGLNRLDCINSRLLKISVCHDLSHNIPVVDHRADLVTAFDVRDTDDIEMLCKEMYRVLDKNGVALVSLSQEQSRRFQKEAERAELWVKSVFGTSMHVSSHLDDISEQDRDLYSEWVRVIPEVWFSHIFAYRYPALSDDVVFACRRMTV